MTDIILHHYEISPYSEKVRLGLGLKGLAWASVEIPVIMPKPDLTALTGGYRKTPVLQIGADIYCDSQLIMRELERRHPTPSQILRPKYRPRRNDGGSAEPARSAARAFRLAGSDAGRRPLVLAGPSA
jgi:glutathione S-transferase